MRKLIWLLLALPLLDLYLVLRLSHVIGGSTVLLVLLASALVGAVVAKQVGMRQLREWRDALAQGRAPTRNVIEGLLLLLGCLWLIVPGPVSDVLGLALFVRPVRARLSEQLMERVRSAIAQGSLHVVVPQARVQTPPDWRARDTNVIDVEGETTQADDAQRRRQLR
jgi:UPF0716 protein FxsA